MLTYGVQVDYSDSLHLIEFLLTKGSHVMALTVDETIPLHYVICPRMYVDRSHF